MMIVMGGTMALQAYGQAQAMEAQGDYQNTMSQINARNAERMGKKAIERGNKSAADFRSKVNQMIGTQKTAYAASGVDIGYGSAKQVQEQTRTLGYDDAITIENNAFLESMGFEQDAFNKKQAGKMGQAALNNQAQQTLISGGLRIAEMAYSNKGGSGLKTTTTTT